MKQKGKHRMQKTSNKNNIYISNLINCNYHKLIVLTKEDLDNTRVYYFDDTDKHFKDVKGITT